jgi:hypothetical protein
MGITWNEKQRAIYELLVKGMSFSQIIEQGYAKSTVSSVQHAFKDGQKPPEKAAQVQTTGSAPLAGIKTPTAGVTMFTIGQENIPLYPEDMLQCFDQFRDMQTELHWESDFSSTLREAIKLLRTVVGSFTPEEVSSGTGTDR